MTLKRKWEIQEGGCDDNDYFLYMSLQLFAMHKPRLQAPSDYISDVFDSLDPSPQHHSCSFRFKWLELIVPWGSSVIYRPGTLLLLLGRPRRGRPMKWKVVPPGAGPRASLQKDSESEESENCPVSLYPLPFCLSVCPSFLAATVTYVSKVRPKF